MRETKTLEFKREVSRAFLKTVSAYANFGTGEILFGVDDDGNVVGVTNPEKTCLEVENYVNSSLKPIPRYTLDIRKMNDRRVVALTVYEGHDKPFYYRGKAYRRSDTADVEVDRLELNRLVLIGQNLSFEEVRSHQQNLTFDALGSELRERIGVETVDADILKTLNLYSDADGYNNAAAVMADENEFAGIDLVRFGESEREILDRERYTGVSALKQLHAALSMYRKYYQYERVDGTRREAHELVPEEAFREAIANALVHRLWDSPANIQVSLSAEDIRITSPGGLPTDISFEEYVGGHVSILRNPIIGTVFYRLDYIEMFGTGIARIQASYKDATVAPKFFASDNLLTVELPVLRYTGSLSTGESTVLECFRKGRLLTRGEVQEASGMGRARAIRALNALINKGYLRKVGSGRATHYELI